MNETWLAHRGVPARALATSGTECLDRARFRAAIAVCAEAILRMHVAERLVNKAFGRNLQSHAAGLALVMHCEALHGLGPRPTLAAIQREMGSPRTLAAFFGLLRLTGYVACEPSASDGRSLWLVPAEPLFTGLRQWLAHHARCAAMLELASPGLAERLRDDDDFLRLYLAYSRKLLDRTRAAMAGEGAWAWFDRFDCGDRIALTLLARHAAMVDAGGAPADPFPLGGRRIAEQIGISHSHVRNVVNRAQAEGLLRQDRQTGLVALAPRFLDESEDWFRRFWGWIGEIERGAIAAGDPAPQTTSRSHRTN